MSVSDDGCGIPSEYLSKISEPFFITKDIGIVLSQLGYRVLEASTGKKALEVWKERGAEIDLVITDFMMPGGMTGKELGQRLMQDDPKLKAIYMSGYRADIVAKEFPLQEGVNFIVKPTFHHRIYHFGHCFPYRNHYYKCIL